MTHFQRDSISSPVFARWQHCGWLLSRAANKSRCQRHSGTVLRRARGPRPAQWKMCPPPHFGQASLDFHLNRPVISLIQLQNTIISLIQLHIVPPAPPAGIVPPPNCPSIWLVPELPLRTLLVHSFITSFIFVYLKLTECNLILYKSENH